MGTKAEAHGSQRLRRGGMLLLAERRSREWLIARQDAELEVLHAGDALGMPTHIYVRWPALEGALHRQTVVRTYERGK